MKMNINCLLKAAAVLTSLLVTGIVTSTVHVEAQNASPPIDATYQIVEQPATNTCATPPDPVLLSGEGHIVFHTTFDNSGGLHITSVDNTLGPLRGVGASGNLYQSNETTVSTTNQSGPSNQFEYTFVHTQKLISQGPFPNFIFYMFSHATVNASGIPVVQIDRFEVRCTP